LKKCDPSDVKQMSWFLVDIPAPLGTDVAVMTCVIPKICDGIDSDGYETLFEKNATDPAQQWVEMIGSINHHFINIPISRVGLYYVQRLCFPIINLLQVK